MPWDEVGSPVETAEEVDDIRSDHINGLSVGEMEKQLINRTLQSTAGNRRKAAEILGISERTLYRKIKQYGL